MALGVWSGVSMGVVEATDTELDMAPELELEETSVGD